LIFPQTMTIEQFRLHIGSIFTFKEYNIDSGATCQAKTHRNTRVCKNKFYFAFLNTETRNITYTCNIGSHIIDDNVNDIIVFMKNGPSSVSVFKRKYGPESYLEHSYAEYQLYKKQEKSLNTLLNIMDNRAMLMGDIDGGYPVNIERIDNIITTGRVVGCDIYNWNVSYRKILVGHRNRYIECVSTLNIFVNNRPPEVDFYINFNVLKLDFKSKSECSILLRNKYCL
jgi:hypothetical protein